MTTIIGTTQRKFPAWPGLTPATLTHTLVRSWVVLQVPGCDIFSSLPNTNPDCGPGGPGSHLQKVKDPGMMHTCARHSEMLRGQNPCPPRVRVGQTNTYIH